MSTSDLLRLGQDVRVHDRERYLTALLTPSDRREHLFALCAFNLEVAKTAEVVSEPMLGQIRLQWWRESLDGIEAGQPRRHEVVEALAEAIVAAQLPLRPFHRLIDARELDLADGPPADMAALLDYTDATSGGLVQLAMLVLGASENEIQPADRLVGTAYALTGLIRAVPFHATRRRLYIPQTLIDETGLDVESVFAGQPSEALAACCGSLARAAREHLDDLKKALRLIPPCGRPGLAPATFARSHLGRLQSADFNPFDQRVQQVSAMMPARLWFGRMLGRF